MIYVLSIIGVVIIGRFVWVYGAVAFLPRLLFPAIRKRDPYPPWQYPFIISWAGVRGGVSLAAVLAIPSLAAVQVNGLDPRDLLIFLVFCVIIVTFVLQGLSLPIILKKVGLDKIGQREKYSQHMTELHVNLQMCQATLHWLKHYKRGMKTDNKHSLERINLYIREYEILEQQNKQIISKHDGKLEIHDELTERSDDIALLYQMIEVKRAVLLRLWRDEKINLHTRTKLLAKLDHQAQHLLI
jgi:CPA1 family monovalent cation:H+ antiporter